MREILDNSGNAYARVKIENGMLMIQLCKSSLPKAWITMDAKVIPQLRQLLTEAEFFKTL